MSAAAWWLTTHRRQLIDRHWPRQPANPLFKHQQQNHRWMTVIIMSRVNDPVPADDNGCVVVVPPGTTGRVPLFIDTTAPFKGLFCWNNSFLGRTPSRHLMH